MIRCWKVLEKSLIFRSCFLYEPCLNEIDADENQEVVASAYDTIKEVVC